MFNQLIKKSIHKSQHCNRNWDLSKSIPQEDVDLITESATQCPVKQNLNFYKTHIITDRDKIKKIHSHTKGFEHLDGTISTNSQILANVLIAFTEDDPIKWMKREWIMKEDHQGKAREHIWNEKHEKECNDIDRLMAVGIATGYVNLVSTMLGYETGCCKCFDEEPISKIIGKEHGDPMLLMGIGYPDSTRSRREHHKDSEIIFPSFKNRRETVIHA